MSLEVELTRAIAKLLVELIAPEGVQGKIATAVGGTLIDHIVRAKQHGTRRSLSGAIETVAREIATNLSQAATDLPTERERSAMISALNDFEGLLREANLTFQRLFALKLEADKIAAHLVSLHKDKYASSSRLSYLSMAATQFAQDLLLHVADTPEFRLALAREQLAILGQIRQNQERLLRAVQSQA